jgi:hypothetical protein
VRYQFDTVDQVRAFVAAVTASGYVADYDAVTCKAHVHIDSHDEEVVREVDRLYDDSSVTGQEG